MTDHDFVAICRNALKLNGVQTQSRLKCRILGSRDLLMIIKDQNTQSKLKNTKRNRIKSFIFGLILLNSKTHHEFAFYSGPCYFY